MWTCKKIQGGFHFLAVVMIWLVLASDYKVGAVITCSSVLSRVSPCLGYLRGGGAVSAACCSGATALNRDAATTPDVQAVCRCIKTLAPAVGAVPSYINSLVHICGINFPFKYSPSIDCSKITR